MSLTRQVSRKVLILQPSNAEVSTAQVYAARYEWRVDGELTIPVSSVIDSLKHVDAKFSIYRVDVSVNKGGTSQYQVLIKSYDTAGANPVVHVDEYITLTGDRNRISIAVNNAAVAENRSLELSLLESTPGIPAQDMTVTLIAEDFAELSPERLGHRILDEAEVVQAQRPDLRFSNLVVEDDALANATNITARAILNNAATELPVRKALQFKGAAVSDDSINNRTVVDMGFIGQYLESDLTLAQHQALYGSGWVLADGVTSCVGTTYGTITGRTVVPDARSMILRGKNHSRADAFADPDGDKALGTQTQDKFESHTHNITGGTTGNAGNMQNSDCTANNRTGVTQATGGNETAPKTLTVNIFIKID